MAHISHLVEDRDITLGDVEDIATLSAAGRLVATEKLDGANVMYSSNSKYEARFSRSESDIKSAGMIAAVLEAKFAGRGLVQDTFSNGANAIRSAVRAFSPLELIQVFEDLQLWYSADIVYTKNHNVVRYDRDVIVLHERPVLRLFGEKIVSADPGQPCAADVQTLLKRVPDMDDNVQASGWQVRGPSRVTLQPMVEQTSLHALRGVLKKMGPPATTLQDFLLDRAFEELTRFRMHEPLLKSAALRLSEAKGAPTLTVLKPRVPSSVALMLRGSKEWVAKQLAPLELAIVDFGVDFLPGVKPSLVDDPDSEAKRIREKLEESLALVKKSRNQHAVEYVAKQMEKLKDPSRVTTPVEGVVFPWKGKLYKITGAFASANAIIGLCRYGRGKDIPPIG